MAKDCEDAPTGAFISIEGDIPPAVNVPGVGLVQELICDDAPGGAITPAFEDSADCKCATRRLCEFDSGEDWWELCEQGGLCKWRPLIDVLLTNTTVDQASTICDWIVTNCRDELTTLITEVVGTALPSLFETYVTNNRNVFCDYITSQQTYPANTTPTCPGDTAGCIVFLVPSNSITTDCPGGTATHVCIDNTLICLGGDSGTGNGGGGTDPNVEITASAYGPNVLTDIPFTSTCDGPRTAMTAPAISTSAAGFCEADESAAVFPTVFTFRNEYHTVVVANGPQDIEISFDMAGYTSGNTFTALLLDSAGNGLPVAVAQANGANIVASTFSCGEPGVEFSSSGLASNGFSASWASVPNGTYTFALVSLRGNTGESQCTTNLTAATTTVIN